MGNTISGAQYAFQQEPLNGVVVANPNGVNQQGPNGINNNPNQPANNNPADNNNNGPPGNFIISLAPRRGGMLDGDNLFGAIRNDLAAYFPFGRMAPPPPVHQTSSIKSLVNLHKDSVHLVRVPIQANNNTADNESQFHQISLEEGQIQAPEQEQAYTHKIAFVFDALEACEVRIIFQPPPPLSVPSSSSSSSSEIPKDKPTDNTEGEVIIGDGVEIVGPILYPRGTGHQVTVPISPSIDLRSFLSSPPSSVLHSPPASPPPNHPLLSSQPLGESDNSLPLPPSSPSPSPQTPHFPVIVEISCPEEASSSSPTKVDLPVPPIRSQSTYCTLLACRDNSYAIKVGQQKINYKGKRYVVHDIFGLDHTGERTVEGSRECVVCMSEPRDTSVLPCRHLCVCKPCAELLAVQPATKCPICRAPVSSLLHITLSKDNNSIPVSDTKSVDDLKEKEVEEEEDRLIARREKIEKLEKVENKDSTQAPSDL